jgi:phasin family protein
MADEPAKGTESAEKAYAAAAAEAKPAKAPAPESKAPMKTPSRKPTVKVAPKKAAAKPRPAVPAAKPASAPAHAKTSEPALPAIEAPAVPVAVAEAPAAEAPKAPVPEPVTTPQLTITELKEKIMASAKTTDFTQPMSDALGEIQTRAKVAYEKGTEAVAEITEFAKGNVEALVESGKILAAGAQDLGKDYVEDAKSAYETFTGDIKEAAAVKSPTELFQLQGKIFRRNFDSLVATSSKNTEALVKLASEAFAPLSGRVDLATEKLSKAA